MSCRLSKTVLSSVCFETVMLGDARRVSGTAWWCAVSRL